MLARPALAPTAGSPGRAALAAAGGARLVRPPPSSSSLLAAAARPSRHLGRSVARQSITPRPRAPSRHAAAAPSVPSAAGPQEADDDDEPEDELEDEDEDEDDGAWDGDEDEDDAEYADEDEDDDEDADEDEGRKDEDEQQPHVEELLEQWDEAAFVEVGVVTRAFGVTGEVRVTPLTDQPRRRLGRRGVRLWLLPPRVGAAGAEAVPGGRRPPLRLAVVRSGRQVRPQRRGGRPESAAWAVRLSCAPLREDAERLAGCRLLLSTADRPELPGDDGDFYVQELVGMDVVLHGPAAAAGDDDKDDDVDGDRESPPEQQQEQQQQQQAPPNYLVASGRFKPGQLVGRVVDVLGGTGAHDTLRVRLAPTPADVRRSRYRTALVPFCAAIVPRVSRSGRFLALDPPEGLLEATADVKMSRPYTDAQKAALLAEMAAEGVPDDEPAAAACGKGGRRQGRRRGGGGGGRASGKGGGAGGGGPAAASA